MVYQRVSADRKQQGFLEEGWEIERVAAALGKSLSVGRKTMICMNFVFLSRKIIRKILDLVANVLRWSETTT